MTDLLNPYIAGAPVVAADMFFGRTDIFEWVERSLMGKYVDHILVIHGQRRVGKTSILKQLPNHLPDRYIPVFFDLQGRTTTSPGRFFWWLSREISRGINSSNGGTVAVPERAELDANPEYLFTRFLPEVQSALGERALLLTFDEFDTLNEPGVAETLALPLIQTLRRMMELEGLSFIYSIGSSGQKLENMQARYTEFFKSALYRKISFLERGACHELITQPVAGVLEYQSEAVARIYQVTAGHPYFTQLVCHELFSRCQQSGVREIQRADVDGVLEQVIERGTVNLKFVWDEADDLEKWALACLARSDECRDPAELANTLRDQRVRFSEPDLNRAIVHLREKDVLGADNRFIVYLLRVWLRQNRPLERVREELVEVSPIANRFIEIGEEYWAQGERESALESFRQALEVDPGSVKARVHLGSLLLEVGQERDAADAYAAALEIDAEDINALRGYCKVQLKLGDRARALGEDEAALESYQAILAVNPEYQLARERLAVMYRERAEASLREGRDEAALLAFTTALSYTPQDVDLAELFEHAKTERLESAVASLTAKSDKAAAQGEWDAAQGALQEALLLAGEDDELERRLAELKAGKRAFLLQSLPQDARDQETQEDWEQACETWRAYLVLYPDDQPEAEAALARAQQMLELQEKYTEAQAALDVKDYPAAIHLLQGIVQVDPNYKDTSRYLAIAVGEGRLDKLDRSKWVKIALPLLFIMITLGAFIGFGGIDRIRSITGSYVSTEPPDGNLSMLSSLETDRPITADTPTATSISSMELSTQTPHMTSTPLPTATPDDEFAFSDSIISSLIDLETDFMDNFTRKKIWTNQYGIEVDQTGSIIEGGIYRMLGSKDDVVQRIPFITKDFVLEVDMRPGSYRGDEAVYSVMIRGEPLGNHYRFDFDVLNETFEIIRDLSNGSYRTLTQGVLPRGVIGTFNKLNIVAVEDSVTFYWNDDPLASITDSSINGDQNFISFSSKSGNAYLDIDNLKIWVLDDETLPFWVADFAQPIIESIRERPADFEEDFSDDNGGWRLSRFNDDGSGTSSALHLSDHIAEGALKLELEPGSHYYLSPQFINEMRKIPDYVIEFDILAESGSGANNMMIDYFRRHPYTFTIYTGDQIWQIGESNAESGVSDSLGSALNTRVLIIAQARQFAVFLNGEPTGYMLGPDNPDEYNENQFSFASFESASRVRLNNIKFWKL